MTPLWDSSVPIPGTAESTFLASPTITKKAKSMNKRAVNYHTRDLSQYPFFNYENTRRPSQGASNHYSGLVASQTVNSGEHLLSDRAHDTNLQKSLYSIDTLPFEKLHMHHQQNNTAKAANSRHFSNFNSTSKQNKKVTYWAGQRIEGGIKPFGLGTDELTRWNDKTNNGGLFENIGKHLKY